MKQSELKKQYLTTKDGIFTPLYTSDNAVAILNDDKQIADYDLPNFKLIKTAEQVYKEWQDIKDNPPKPEPTDKERIAELENVISEMIKAGA